MINVQMDTLNNTEVWCDSICLDMSVPSVDSRKIELIE